MIIGSRQRLAKEDNDLASQTQDTNKKRVNCTKTLSITVDDQLLW